MNNNSQTTRQHNNTYAYGCYGKHNTRWDKMKEERSGKRTRRIMKNK